MVVDGQMPPDKGYVLDITALIMTIVAALTVIIRLAWRICTTRFGSDDIMIALSLVSQQRYLQLSISGVLIRIRVHLLH